MLKHDPVFSEYSAMKIEADGESIYDFLGVGTKVRFKKGWAKFAPPAGAERATFSRGTVGAAAGAAAGRLAPAEGEASMLQPAVTAAGAGAAGEAVASPPLALLASTRATCRRSASAGLRAYSACCSHPPRCARSQATIASASLGAGVVFCERPQSEMRCGSRASVACCWPFMSSGDCSAAAAAASVVWPCRSVDASTLAPGWKKTDIQNSFVPR